MVDEPTGNLEFTTGKMILELLMRLNREENRILVIVTHDPNIAKVGRQTIKIQDGKIVIQ